VVTSLFIDDVTYDLEVDKHAPADASRKSGAVHGPVRSRQA
jgi:hypothetical protein